VRFASRPRAGMPRMVRALVFDVDLERTKGVDKLPADFAGNGHVFPLHAARECQALRFLVFLHLHPIIQE
jgi:hypothetical protein